MANLQKLLGITGLLEVSRDPMKEVARQSEPPSAILENGKAHDPGFDVDCHSEEEGEFRHHERTALCDQKSRSCGGTVSDQTVVSSAPTGSIDWRGTSEQSASSASEGIVA